MPTTNTAVESGCSSERRCSLAPMAVMEPRVATSGSFIIAEPLMRTTITQISRLCLLTGACLLATSNVFAQTLRIYHIDVEQADSALVVMPNGKTLLIDSGKNGHGKRIKAVMDHAGVTQIDAFVDSHYHEDHFGGIDDLRKLNVPILESYDRGRRDLVKAADKAEGTYKDYMQAVGEDAHAL